MHLVGLQDIQNQLATKENLLPAVAKRSIADFGNGMDHITWKVTRAGAEETATSKVLDRGQNRATISTTKHGNFRFKGTWPVMVRIHQVHVSLSML